MTPQCIATLGATRMAHGGEEIRGLSQCTRAKLETDKRGEGLLGRATGSATTAHRFAHLTRGRKPITDRCLDNIINPAFDECEQSLETRKCCALLFGVLRLEQAGG